MRNGALTRCASCRAELPDGADRCVACGWYVTDLAAAHAVAVASAHRVAEARANPIAGEMRHRSWLPLPGGKANERHVIAVLAELLTRIRGNRVAGRVDDEALGDGHFALQFGPGDEVTVQVAMVLPYYGPWEELARGRHSHEPTADQLAGRLRAALENSREDVNPSRWLALNAMYLPRAGQPQVVAAYLERYGDPAHEYGWNKVWVVGPSTTTTVQLALAGGLVHDQPRW